MLQTNYINANSKLNKLHNEGLHENLIKGSLYIILNYIFQHKSLAHNRIFRNP